MLTACNTPNIKEHKTSITYSTNGVSVDEYDIDGCQYIGHLSGMDWDWASHKGNCKNPIHQCQKTDTIYLTKFILVYGKDTIQ